MLKQEKKKRTEKKLFFSIFMPFFVIFLILFSSILFLTARALALIENEALETAKKQGETIRTEIMLELTETLPALALIGNCSELQSLVETDLKDRSAFALRSYYLQKEMQRVLTDAYYFAVYIPSKDYILTTKNAYDRNTKELFEDANGITQEELDELLKHKNTFGYISHQHAWSTLRIKSANGIEALLIADYNLEEVINRTLKEDEFYALSVDRNIVLSNSRKYSDFSYEQLFTESESTKQKISDHMYAIISVSMPVRNMELSVGIPFSKWESALRRFQWVTMTIAAGAFLLSLFVALLYTKRYYTALNHLNALSGQGENHISVMRSLENAGRYILKLDSENQNYRKDISEAAPIMLGKALQMLEEASEQTRESSIREVQSLSGLSPKDGISLFALAIFEDENGIFSEEVQDARFGKNGMEYFFLKNFMDDILFGEFRGVLAVCDGYYVTLLEGAENTGRISGIKKELEEVCFRYMHVRILTTDVYTVTDSRLFANTVRAASEKIRYDLFWGQEEEWQSISDNPQISYTESVRHLINSLSVRDYTEAEKAVDDVIAALIPGDEQNIRKVIYRMYGTIGIVTAVIESQIDENWENIEEIDYAGRLYRVRNIREFRTESKRILSELVRFREEYRKNAVPDIVVQAKRYIDDHYTESGTNVSAVADALGVSDSYLTRMFRNSMDCNILEYIQRRRVEKARELLATESVKETANLVGLWDTQALIRLYRKYEGITPGAYKDQLAREKKQRDEKTS